jgi:hypothetical protein
MSTAACLLAATFAAPTAGPAEVVLYPHLAQGQELVYRGRFVEEAVRPGVQAQRTCDITTRLLVLEVKPQYAELACCTTVRPGDLPADTPPVSVRLELLRVDWRGRLSRPPGEVGPPLAAPLEGPPALEVSVFLETPDGRASPGRTWDLMPDGRPPVAWRVEGSEARPKGRCLKAAGVQQSENWEPGRAATLPPAPAWHRQETLWVSVETGLASRVERRIERRALGSNEVTQQSLLTLDQESSLIIPGPLFESQRREFVQARSFADTLTGLRPPAGPAGERPWDVLQAKVEHHLTHHPSSPYREAVLWVQRRAAEARHGQAAPLPPAPEAPAPARLAVGQPAPDFVAADLGSGEVVRLSRWQGRPVLLALYDPASQWAGPLLNGLQTIQRRHGARAWVAAVAVADGEAGRRQKADLHLTFPVFAGGDVCRRFEPEGTPRFVVLDTTGTVRAIAPGWGEGMAASLEQELLRWVRP